MPIPPGTVERRRGHDGDCSNHDGEWRRHGGIIPGIDTEKPYTDDRPLLVPGQAEVREYRLRFWDKGVANGEWSESASVTVGPA